MKEKYVQMYMDFVCSNSVLLLLFIWLIFQFIIIEKVILLNKEKNYINTLLNLKMKILELLIGNKINIKILDKNSGLYKSKNFFWIKS